jgi:amino acid transporter
LRVLVRVSLLTFFRSFARDRGIPFHKYFAKVSEKRATPVRAMKATLVITVILSAFNTLPGVALSTLISLSLTGLLSSYALTIASGLSYKIRGEPPRQSPFNLGKPQIRIKPAR